MANFSTLKAAPKARRNGLGAPPPPEEASPNLTAPETAPLHPAPGAPVVGRIDGRKLRATGRTLQFATRVTPEFDARVREIAMRDGLRIVEVLERAIDAYEAAR